MHPYHGLGTKDAVGGNRFLDSNRRKMAKIVSSAMVSKNEVPFGNWVSPITVESVASEKRAISSPRVHASPLLRYLHNYENLIL